MKTSPIGTYQTLKGSIEKRLSNPIIWLLVKWKQAKLLEKIVIPGHVEKSPADSRRHKTDVQIAIEEKSVHVKIGPFTADCANDGFPFKNTFLFFEKINVELLKLEDRLKWWSLLKSIFI